MRRKVARTHTNMRALNGGARRAAVGTRPQLVIFFVRIPAAKVSTGKAGEDGMDSPWPRASERRRRAARKGCCTKSANGFARGAPPPPLLLPPPQQRRERRPMGSTSGRLLPSQSLLLLLAGRARASERVMLSQAGSHQHILSHGIQMNGHTQIIPPAAASAGRPPRAPTPVTQIERVRSRRPALQFRHDLSQGRSTFCARRWTRAHLCIYAIGAH
jgi:hypothetical protein